MSYTPALYQCVCGKVFTSRAVAALHTATAIRGNHIIKQVR